MLASLGQVLVKIAQSSVPRHGAFSSALQSTSTWGRPMSYCNVGSEEGVGFVLMTVIFTVCWSSGSVCNEQNFNHVSEGDHSRECAHR